MATVRENVERRLARVQTAIDQYTSQLKAAGKAEADYGRDTKWRHLNGDASQLRALLVRIGQVEEVNAAAEKAKAEKAGAAAE